MKPNHLTPAQLDSLLAKHGFTRLQIRYKIGGLLYQRDGRILFVFTWMNTRISPLAAINIREVEGELPEITRDSQQIHAREIARVEFPAGAWPLPASAEAELARILSEVTI